MKKYFFSIVLMTITSICSFAQIKSLDCKNVAITPFQSTAVQYLPTPYQTVANSIYNSIANYQADLSSSNCSFNNLNQIFTVAQNTSLTISPFSTGSFTISDLISKISTNGRLNNMATMLNNYSSQFSLEKTNAYKGLQQVIENSQVLKIFNQDLQILLIK